MSSLSELQGDDRVAAWFNLRMAKPLPDMAFRMVLLRVAKEKKAADLVKKTGIAWSDWSQYEAGNRPVSLTQAHKLRATYSVTLDWIFYGDPAGLPRDLHTELYSPETRKKALAELKKFTQSKERA